MRKYIPIKPAALPQPDDRDFIARLREKLTRIDYFLQDVDAGFGRIIVGENPDGSGGPIGDGGTLGDQFWFLPGRPNNTVAHGGSGDSGSATISSTSSGVKGKVYLGSAQNSAYDEANERLGIGTDSPSATLHISGSVNNDLTMRPSGPSQDSATPWRGHDGGIDLSSYLDETSADDNDYIKVSLDPADASVSQTSARLRLIPPASTPSASNTHVLRVRYRRTGSGGIGAPTGPGIDAALYRNETVLTGTWISVAEPAISGSFTTATVTLSGAQITALTDYSNLELWINWTGSRTGCSADSEMQVSWAELDCGLTSSVADIARFDDGGLGVLPTTIWDSAQTIILNAATTDNPDTSARLRIETSNAGTVFEVKGDGSTTIATPYTTYSSGNPILLSLEMADSTSSSSTIFRIRTQNANVFTTSYSGATNIDMAANSVALSIDGFGGAADLTRWSNSGATLSYIASDGTFNGPIAPTGLVTFDHIVIDNATATDVLLKMIPHATQSADILQVRNSGDSASVVAIGVGGATTISPATDVKLLTLRGSASQMEYLLLLEASGGTDLAFFDPNGSLTIQPNTDVTALKLITPSAAANTVLNVLENAGVIALFKVDPSGTVTAGDTTTANTGVKLQARAPTTQASNIFQIIRAYAGGNYAAFAVSSGGSLVIGDGLADASAVIKMRMRQSTGQSVDNMQVRNAADTANFFAVGSGGVVTISPESGTALTLTPPAGATKNLSAVYTDTAAVGTGLTAGIWELAPTLSNAAGITADIHVLFIKPTVSNIVNRLIRGLRVELIGSLDATDTGSTQLTGLQFLAQGSGSSGTFSNVRGIDATAQLTGGVGATNISAMQATVTISAGAATTARGIFIGGTVAGGTTTTDLEWIRINDPAGTGTVTTQYGIRIGNLTQGVTNWAFYSAGGQSSHVGNFYLGANTAPTARLHFAAQTTAASTAPLKMTAGTLMTTPETGAQGEFDGDFFYQTRKSAREGEATDGNAVVDEDGNVVTFDGDLLLAA